MARLQTQGVGVLFLFGSTQDEKDSTQVIGTAEQGGLGFPTATTTSSRTTSRSSFATQYVQHVAKMFELAGDAPDTAAAEARTVMAIETQIGASVQDARRAARSRRQLSQDEPGRAPRAHARFLLGHLFPRISVFPDIGEVNVGQPEFFQALDKQLTSVPARRLEGLPALARDSCRRARRFLESSWTRISISTAARSPAPRRFSRAGSAASPPPTAIWAKRSGRNMWRRHFRRRPRTAPRRWCKIWSRRLRADIETLPWMSEPTRQQALAKLSAMTLKIGYPDKWRDYSAFQVVRGSYVENRRARQRVRVSPQPRADRQARGPHRMGHDARPR